MPNERARITKRGLSADGQSGVTILPPAGMPAPCPSVPAPGNGPTTLSAATGPTTTQDIRTSTCPVCGSARVSPKISPPCGPVRDRRLLSSLTELPANGSILLSRAPLSEAVHFSGRKGKHSLSLATTRMVSSKTTDRYPLRRLRACSTIVAKGVGARCYKDHRARQSGRPPPCTVYRIATSPCRRKRKISVLLRGRLSPVQLSCKPTTSRPSTARRYSLILIGMSPAGQD